MESYELISACTSSEYSGEGSRFCFVFETQDNFNVYARDESGAIGRYTIPVEQTTIYFTEDIPKGEKIEETYIILRKDGFGKIHKDQTDVITSYKLYVPEGTIHSFSFN